MTLSLIHILLAFRRDMSMATSKPRLDRRIVRSRNAILSAFERLLMDKPLADITAVSYTHLNLGRGFLATPARITSGSSD